MLRPVLLLLLAALGSAQNCQPNTTHVCQCDANCAFFKDCCPEVAKERSFNAAGPSFHSCVRSDSLRIKILSISPACALGIIAVVNKCPATFPDASVIKDCERTGLSSGLAYEVPVVDERKRLFRNRFCAQCHGAGDVDKANVTQFRCREPPTRENLVRQLQNGSCVVTLSVAKAAIRFCPPVEISECLEGWAQKDCAGGAVQRVTCDRRVFRNEACARCAGGKSCRPFARPCKMDSLQTQTHPDYRFLFDFLSEPKNESNSTSPQAAAQQVAITVCSSLSIVALLLLLVIYAALKPFHNFGGLMTGTLAACLVAAYSFLLTSGALSESTAACAVVGRLLHLAFLTSFAWMALMGFDLLRNFKRTSGSRDGGFWRRYLRYGAFGWGAPLLIAGLGLILDLAAPEGPVSPAFGSPKCYMNRPYALLLWMFVPVALIILFNCIIMAFLFHFFYTASQDTRRVRANVKRSMLLLCVKVTLVLGVVWLAQLVDVFNQQSAEASFVVSLFASLQGLGIALVFLLTKQTKANVKSSISRSRTTSSTLSTTKHRVVNPGAQRSATSSQEKL